MHDSDILKFDDHIGHNATLDNRTRLALYSNIRRQIARNFERANKSHENPVCRYCRVEIGPFNDYVAFVVFSSDTVEFNTSASQDESVPSATADKSMGAEQISDLGKSESKFHQAGKKVSKTADRSEVKAENREILGDIVQRKSEKKKDDRRLPKRKSVITSGPEATETSSAGKQLTQKQVSNVTEVSSHENVTHEVVSEIETGVTNTSAAPVDNLSDVEPVDESNNNNGQSDRMMNEEQLDTADKQDVAKQSDMTATAEVSSLPCRHEVIVEVSGQFKDSSEMNTSIKLCVWKNETQLNLDASADIKNVEFEKLSEWLSSRMSLTTSIHRFPAQYDLPVLGPRENQERSVTWRLAEKFSPCSEVKRKLGTKEKTHGKHFPDVPWAGEQTLEGGKAASHVVFICPYDPVVVSRPSELVRRRVGQIIDDLLPQSSSDVFCVTDVGCDVGVTCVGDIVNTSRLSAVQFCAYTVSNAESAPVSCVLLRFSPSAV